MGIMNTSRVFLPSSSASGAPKSRLSRSFNPLRRKDLSILITPATDANYTLSDIENQYGRIEINTINWAVARDIICNNVEHTFLALVNSTGSQDATFKTSGGTGILVNAGGRAKLRNDTINILAFLGSLTGTTTFTNVDNNFSLTGIGTIGLEIGDVINITNSVSNNQNFTVEVITDDDNIIVNAAHAGAVTSKSLIDEASTAGVTIILVSKYYNAAPTLGLGWANVLSIRTNNVLQTNTLNREIKVAFSGAGSTESNRVKMIMNGDFTIEATDSGSVEEFLQVEVAIGNTYTPFAPNGLITFWELR